MKLQALVLAVLVWSGHVQFWHVAVLAAVYGLGRALDIPARQAYVTDLVGRPDLANAVALNSVVMNGARIVGPAVAGLLISGFGVAMAFLLNGASFVVVLAVLLAIRTDGQPDPAGRIGIREGLLGAVTYAAETPPVAFTLGLMVVVSLLALNFNVVVPLVARDMLKLGAHGFGLLMSALGVGAVAGGFGIALLRRDLPPLPRRLGGGPLHGPSGAGDGPPFRYRGLRAGAAGWLSDLFHDGLQHHPAAHRAQRPPRSGDGALHRDLRRHDAVRLAAGGNHRRAPGRACGRRRGRRGRSARRGGDRAGRAPRRPHVEARAGDVTSEITRALETT